MHMWGAELVNLITAAVLAGADHDSKAHPALIKTTAHPEGVNLAVLSAAEEEVPTLLFACRAGLESPETRT